MKLLCIVPVIEIFRTQIALTREGRAGRICMCRAGETVRMAITPEEAALPDALADGPAGPRIPTSVRAEACWPATSAPRVAAGCDALPQPAIAPPLAMDAKIEFFSFAPV
jgi:hypothetical protein